MRKNEKLVEIVIVLCLVFLMTLSVIAAEQKFHKHSSIFGAPLLLLLNEWFESHHTFSPLVKLLAFLSFKCHARNEEEDEGQLRRLRGSVQVGFDPPGLSFPCLSGCRLSPQLSIARSKNHCSPRVQRHPTALPLSGFIGLLSHRPLLRCLPNI